MLKTSSLASVVTYGELLRRASDIYSTNLRDRRAAAGRQHLVPGADQRGHRRPVLPRAPLRPRARPASCRRPRCSGCAATWRLRRVSDARDASPTGPDAPMVVAQGVRKHFGRLEVLQGHRPDGRSAGEVHGHPRPVGLGQVDVPALHQPPREDRRRPHLRRRPAGRVPPGGRQAPRAEGAGGGRPRGPRSAWSSSASTCSRT